MRPLIATPFLLILVPIWLSLTGMAQAPGEQLNKYAPLGAPFDQTASYVLVGLRFTDNSKSEGLKIRGAKFNRETEKTIRGGETEFDFGVANQRNFLFSVVSEDLTVTSYHLLKLPESDYIFPFSFDYYKLADNVQGITSRIDCLYHDTYVFSTVIGSVRYIGNFSYESGYRKGRANVTIAQPGGWAEREVNLEVAQAYIEENYTDFPKLDAVEPENVSVRPVPRYPGGGWCNR